MRIAAYQFPISANLNKNLQQIFAGMQKAADRGARLLLLPECALTGYPGKDLESPNQIDVSAVETALVELAGYSTALDLAIVFGMVERREGAFFNSAMLAVPNKPIRVIYRKRALWGWDIDNFQPGNDADGTVEIEGFRFGVRICFEVRFPEYFRELFRRNTDCNLVLFCDRSDPDSTERYNLITAHLKTRAVENVTVTLSVNTCSKYQTAPTAAIDEDGVTRAELPRHELGLLLYDLERKSELSFGAKGRKQVSIKLAGME